MTQDQAAQLIARLDHIDYGVSLCCIALFCVAFAAFMHGLLK